MAELRDEIASLTIGAEFQHVGFKWDMDEVAEELPGVYNDNMELARLILSIIKAKVDEIKNPYDDGKDEQMIMTLGLINAFEKCRDAVMELLK